MNVSSLELSKKLYELSGWGMTHLKHQWYDDGSGKNIIESSDIHIYKDHSFFCPAYNCGYLLRKLPHETELTNSTGKWSALSTSTSTPSYIFLVNADTPENALVKLAIKLFEEGILEKEIPFPNRNRLYYLLNQTLFNNYCKAI